MNILCTLAVLLALITSPAFAAVIYNNDTPNNLIGVSTNPAGAGRIEHETGDDFILNASTLITGGTFTGLIPTGATIANVVVEIYRVFPKDSVFPPDNRVITRVNSPSDNAFDSRDASLSTLTFTTSVLAGSFTVSNSVVNGINAFPNQTTSGEGPRTGQEVRFSVNFATPFSLPADHYFFVPQEGLSAGSTFLWLSADRPIVGQFAFAPDLQAWTRDANLDPDWSRVGTDIVGGATPPTFNLAFSLDGTQVPEPATIGFVLCGIGLLGWKRSRSS